jgi:hypothetical protein
MICLPRRGRAGCLRRRIEDQAYVIIIKNLGDIGNVVLEPMGNLWLSVVSSPENRGYRARYIRAWELCSVLGRRGGQKRSLDEEFLGCRTQQ